MTKDALSLVTGGEISLGWLDLQCPECSRYNRIGIRTCPLYEKIPCKRCGYELPFWEAWSEVDKLEEHDERLREYWADQF